MLNRSYLPIHITTVKRAVSLLCLEIAVGVDSEYQTYSWGELVEGIKEETKREIPKREDFHYLRTVNAHVAIPKVVLLHDFDRRPPQNIRFSRTQIFLRDAHTCQYCGKNLPKQRLNLDHVVPRIQGGKTTWENVVTSCHFCNRRKGGRTPQQAGMKLLTIPHKPKISPTLLMLRDMNPSWNSFILTG